jgi:hypothetical protein
VDIAVNNAGIIHDLLRTSDISEETFDATSRSTSRARYCACAIDLLCLLAIYRDEGEWKNL